LAKKLRVIERVKRLQPQFQRFRFGAVSLGSQQRCVLVVIERHREGRTTGTARPRKIAGYFRRPGRLSARLLGPQAIFGKEVLPLVREKERALGSV
jgi:hypothetical protein